MSKSNAYRWSRELSKKIQKVWISPKTETSDYELDELYWYIGCRKGYELGVNTYVMTMLSRTPHQIVGFAVDTHRSQQHIQSIVDSVPTANKYHTDGFPLYKAVIFGGHHN